jgi:hypothetical protein
MMILHYEELMLAVVVVRAHTFTRKKYRFAFFTPFELFLMFFKTLFSSTALAA